MPRPVITWNMAPRRSVRETGSKRLRTTLPVLCRLDDIADSDAPAFVDLAAPLGATIVNPTMFMTYPSAFLPADAADRPRHTGPPRVWIRDTLAGALWPFSATGSSEPVVRRLAAPRIEGLSPSEITLLRKATLLVRPEELARRELAGNAQAGSAAGQFRQHGWCVLKDIVHPAHLTALARRYDALVQSGRWRLGDQQVSRRYSRANEDAARFFHRQFTGYLGHVLGVRIRPTYSFVCFYQGGASLERHTDRAACEFTLSLTVGHSPGASWPLKLETPAGTEEVTCRPGEAVLFGRNIPHSRDRLSPGHTWTTVLFHYVRAER